MADTPAQIAAKKKAALAKLKLTDAQIIKQMQTQTPWIYQTYLSPEFTDAMKATLIQWARDSAAGYPPTIEEQKAQTYTWPMTQLWSANQNDKFNLSFTAPGEYKKQLEGVTASVDKYIKQMGNKIDETTRQDLINDVFLKGWDVNDPRIQEIVSGTFKPDNALSGTALNAVDQVKSIANSYMIPVDPDVLQKWGKALQGGTATAEDVTAYFKGQASSLYRFMAGSIDHITPQDWFAPVKTLIANNLEMPTSQIDFADPSGKWMNLVTKKDPKTGETLARDNADILNEIRTNPLYGFNETMGAKNSAYDLAARIKGVFNRGTVAV